MQSNLKYVKAPSEWSYADKNPFTEDGMYGSAWSAFCILEQDSDQFMTGQSGHGPFSARFGRRVPNLERRLVDFLRYENGYGRTVILSLPEGMDVDAYVTQAIIVAPEATTVRPEDPAFLVHATTRGAWESIQADGELKAASQLANRRVFEDGRPGTVADYLSHEPPEYSDYIMFGEMHSCVPEMVFASNQAGKFILDADAVFEPGVRLYFDNHRIIRDGLGTRDGLHVMKVHLRLPVQPYLLAAVRVEDIDPEAQVKAWTLRSFVDAANAVFQGRRLTSQKF